MATNVGKKTCHGSIGTTQDYIQLTDYVNQIAIVNTHATQSISVMVATGNTAATALTAAQALTVTTGVDESFTIPAGKRDVVFKSPRGKYVALAIIGSGATTTYACHGTTFFD
jgi:hypothetical protein